MRLGSSTSPYMICFTKVCHVLLHFRWICYTLADRAGAQLVCTSTITFIEVVEMVDDHAPQKSEIPDRKTREDTSTFVRRVWKFQFKHHFWSVNSLGNHTVNKLHRFGVVFVCFNREDFFFRAFAKIFWIRLALPHFSCIHFFYWGASLLGEILDLLLKMLSKTWLYKCYKLCAWNECFPLIHLTFATTFSTVNPTFLLEDLLLSKKSVYMKNAEERARFKIFWRKLWKWSLPCQILQNLWFWRVILWGGMPHHLPKSPFWARKQKSELTVFNLTPWKISIFT